jgi:hypothetical protein
VHAQDFIVN